MSEKGMKELKRLLDNGGGTVFWFGWKDLYRRHIDFTEEVKELFKKIEDLETTNYELEQKLQEGE